MYVIQLNVHWCGRRGRFQTSFLVAKTWRGSTSLGSWSPPRSRVHRASHWSGSARAHSDTDHTCRENTWHRAEFPSLAYRLHQTLKRHRYFFFIIILLFSQTYTVSVFFSYMLFYLHPNCVCCKYFIWCILAFILSVLWKETPVIN